MMFGWRFAIQCLNKGGNSLIWHEVGKATDVETGCV